MRARRAAADAGPPYRSVHGRGRACHGGRGAWRPRARPDGAARRAARTRADAQSGCGAESQGSRDLGQGLAQRGLPVRLGQEIQALPRQARLRRSALLRAGAHKLQLCDTASVLVPIARQCRVSACNGVRADPVAGTGGKRRRPSGASRAIALWCRRCESSRHRCQDP